MILFGLSGSRLYQGSKIIFKKAVRIEKQVYKSSLTAVLQISSYQRHIDMTSTCIVNIN